MTSPEDALLSSLRSLKEQLRSNDPALTHLQPLKHVPPSQLYALTTTNEAIYQALHDVWEACVGNRRVRRVTLEGLLDVELRSALRHVSGLLQLQELTIRNIGHTSSTVDVASLQSLLQLQRPITVVAPAPKGQSRMERAAAQASPRSPSVRKGLQRLRLASPLLIRSEEQVHELAGSLVDLTFLQVLSLRLDLQCSSSTEALLDPILSVCTYFPHLQTLRLSLEHEINDCCPISADALTLLLTTTTSLQVLDLGNLVRSAQATMVSALAQGLRRNASLKSVAVPLVPHWQDLQQLVEAIDQDNVTLEQIKILEEVYDVDDPNLPTPAYLALEQSLQTILVLNRLGRGHLRGQRSDRRLWMQALLMANTMDDQQQDRSLDVLYALLRSNPQVCSLPSTSEQSATPPSLISIPNHKAVR